LDSFSSSGGESNHPHEIIDLLDHANVHSFSSGSFSSLSFHLTIQEICVKSGEALNNTMSPLPSQLLVPSDPSSASAVFKSCTQRDCKEAQKRERLVKSVLMTVASVMFGNNTYHVKAFWSNLLFQRSYQGTICVGLAASMVAGNFLHGSSLLIPCFFNSSNISGMVGSTLPACYGRNCNRICSIARCHIYSSIRVRRMYGKPHGEA
jgi:hypothetical protein